MGVECTLMQGFYEATKYDDMREKPTEMYYLSVIRL